MKLSSSEGATFTCAVDGGKTKPCTSPYKKTFKYGKRVILVTAVSAAGISDPTPVEVKFRVVRPGPRTGPSGVTGTAPPAGTSGGSASRSAGRRRGRRRWSAWSPWALP